MNLDQSAIKTFAERLAKLAEDAVLLHALMSKNADAPETFIRSQVAVGMYNELKVVVAQEVYCNDFRDYVLDRRNRQQRSAYDALKPKLKVLGRSQFHLDLVVWGSAGGPPSPPQAIIEVKRGSSTDNDVATTALLLTLFDQNTLGYQVEAQIGPEQRMRDRLAHARRLGAVVRSPVAIPNTINSDWCLAFALPVQRLALPLAA